MIRRVLFPVLLLLFPLSAFAQNDFGVWVNTTSWKSTSEDDFGIPGASAELKFDQKIGYGISFNHFTGPNLSFEFGAHQLRGDAKLGLRSVPQGIDETFDVGTLKTNAITGIVQWHFAPRSFITPYVGAGVVYFTGSQLHIDADAANGIDAENVKFDNKFGFAANAGVNFAVMSRMSVALDGRYASYKARDKNDPDPATNSLKLDPFTISLGLRFRM